VTVGRRREQAEDGAGMKSFEGIGRALALQRVAAGARI